MPQLTVKKDNLPNTVTHPHLGTVYEAWVVNGNFKVLLAETKKIRHLRIRRIDNLAITEYKIFQEIKNHFWGVDTVAIQVFPKQEDYIDNSNTYHLFTWKGIDVPNLKSLYKYNK